MTPYTWPWKAGAKLVPVGPPNRYEEVAAHAKVTLWACEPCVEVRGVAALDRRIKRGGMNEFHAAAKRAGCEGDQLLRLGPSAVHDQKMIEWHRQSDQRANS
jgi:hypothetical protein